MQKIVCFCGEFDKNCNWHDNMEEINKELENGWRIENSESHLFIYSWVSVQDKRKIIGNVPVNEKVVSHIILEKPVYKDEPLELIIGSALIPLAMGNDCKLFDELKNARKKIYFPMVRIIDSIVFEPNEYKLLSFSTIVAREILNNESPPEEKISKIINTIINYVKGGTINN